MKNCKKIYLLFCFPLFLGGLQGTTLTIKSLLNGQELKIPYTPSDQLIEIQKKIKKIAEIPIEEQIILYLGKPLQNPYQTIEAYNLSSDKKIFLMIKCGYYNHNVKIEDRTHKVPTSNGCGCHPGKPKLNKENQESSSSIEKHPPPSLVEAINSNIPDLLPDNKDAEKTSPQKKALITLLILASLFGLSTTIYTVDKRLHPKKKEENNQKKENEKPTKKT